VIGVQFQQMRFTLYSAFIALLQPTIAPNWIDTVHGPVYPGKFFREIYAEFKASLKDFDWDVYANGRGHLVEPGKFECFGKWKDAVVYGARKQEIKDPIDDTPALEEDGDPRVGASTVAPSISACGEHGAWSSVEQLCVCHDGWKTVGSDPCSALISSILGGDGGMGEMASSDNDSSGNGWFLIAIILVVIIIGVACFFLRRFYHTRGFYAPTLRRSSHTKSQNFRD
ncbi:hypothetical protein FOZ62_009728, partial [Perkinsus olseni]